MTLEYGIALFGALATATNLLNAYLTSKVRGEITLLKLEVAEQRSADREWLNEKFMTRSEIEHRFRAIEERFRHSRVH